MDKTHLEGDGMTFLRQFAAYKNALEDLEAKIEELSGYKEQYFDCRDKLIKADETIQNQQRVIDNTRKTLESLTKENEALKALVKIWA